MSQAELSRLTGIRAATICEIYNEMVVHLNVDHLDLICEALDCRLDELIEYKPSKVRIAGTELVMRSKRRKKQSSKPV